MMRSWSNCIVFAILLYVRRARKARKENKRHTGYLALRRSDWGRFPHVLYASIRADGSLRLVSYKPVSPKRRRIPPPLFRGAVKWGDRNRKRPD
jgi:hypothetical protein